MVARGWKGGPGRMSAHGDGVPFGGDGNVLDLDRGDDCTTLQIYVAKELCTSNG